MEVLIKSDKNILTLQELGVLWQMQDRRKLIETVKYYLAKGRLISLRRGLYAFDNNYSDLELAQKIIPLSYLSLHTALAFHGIIFQYREDVYCVGLKSEKVFLNGKKFIYSKIKDEIFFNKLGLLEEKNYTIASPERAVCDSLYYYGELAFDNLDTISKNKLIKISKIYSNKSLIDRVYKLIELHNVQ